MHEGVIGELESGAIPPCRLQIEKMIPLLRGLQLTSDRVIDVIRRTSVDWAQHAYRQPQTQLGRIDPELDDEERVRLLETEAESELERELTEIEGYCRVLATRLS